MKTLCFFGGVGVGILICHPDVVTGLVVRIVEKQADAKRDMVHNTKIIEEDLQAFLKQNPPTKS
jgi:hypothetical protein